KAEERAHILEGLVKALANIDEVVKIIRQSRDKFEAAEKLITKFILSDKQANAILEMRLHRLTSLEVETVRQELAELHRLIAEYKQIIGSKERICAIVRAELLDVKEKFATPRLTDMSYEYGDIDIADMIDKEDVVISMTHFGYIKRLPVTEYRTQKRGGKGITAHRPKEEDFVEDMFITSTHDDLLFFTNRGKVYMIKAYEVPEAQRTARGRAIVNLLQLEEGERVSAVIPISEDYSKGNLMMATRMGLVKKTALEQFESIRKVGKIAISLLDGDELISVQLTCGRDEMLLASSEGKCIRFSEEDVRLMGRTAQGVRSMKLNSDDYVVDMAVLKPGYKILTVSQFGYGKRTEIEEYRLQSRAGKGIKAGIFNDKTGRLVNLKLVSDDEDIMVISSDGTIIRMRSKDVSHISRDTRGVRVMRMHDDAEVVCVAVAAAQADDGEDATGDATGGAEE
ncbi:MAG: DNA gyrase subunit A, partial [Clostridiales bacterium]|nr:DNA gyrase subunit A [Clostridiales bacterium]